MPDKVKPAVPVTLDKERHFLFNLNAMAAFEMATGKSLLERKVIDSLYKGMKPGDMRALLWACLIHEDKKLTLEQVGGMVNIDNILEITTKLWMAWAAAIPEAEEGEVEAPLAVSPPAG